MLDSHRLQELRQIFHREHWTGAPHVIPSSAEEREYAEIVGKAVSIVSRHIVGEAKNTHLEIGYRYTSLDGSPRWTTFSTSDLQVSDDDAVRQIAKELATLARFPSDPNDEEALG